MGASIQGEDTKYYTIIITIVMKSDLACRREAHYLDHQNKHSGYCVDTKECSQLALKYLNWTFTVRLGVKSAGTRSLESYS